MKNGKGKKLGSNVPVYIKDLVAGRPVFGHPSRSGAFRYRYGRSRVDGFSAASLHPATMAITDGFIAIGTQLKIEKPTKGCAIASCDSIDGPIVKLINGSVKKLNSYSESKEIYKNVEEIIYLGDILFPFSDLANRNSNLIKPGYVEEWWNLELEKLGGKVTNYFEISIEEAIKFSQDFGVPLHPNFIFYWTQISKEQFLKLIEWLSFAQIRGEKIIFPFNSSEQEKFNFGKRALEVLGIPHEVTIENVVLDKEVSKAFLINLGFDLDLLKKEELLFKDKIDFFGL